MGYTHYWTLQNGLEQADWNKFLEVAREIIKTAQDAGVRLEDNSSDSAIFINGVGEQAHETFLMRTDDVGFNFCKTAEKPYDSVVTAILILAKTVFKNDIEVSSDGSWSNWQGGRLLYETVIGISPESVLTREGE